MDDQISSTNTNVIDESNLQRPNLYNKYSPFYDAIKRQSAALFDEIRENLSRTIRFGELEPGFSIWSKKLKHFLSIYEFSFTKNDHLKLIQFYLSILSIPDLNYVHVQISFDMLYELLRFVVICLLYSINRREDFFLSRRTHLINRDDLTIDWKIFHGFAQVIFGYEDKICRLITLPELVFSSSNNV